MEDISYIDLRWNSYWIGDEVGYPEILVVGYYTDLEGNNYYIDIKNDIVLEHWIDDEEF